MTSIDNLTDIGVSTRLACALARVHITTVGELAEIPDNRLKQIEGIGKKLYYEAKSLINTYKNQSDIDALITEHRYRRGGCLIELNSANEIYNYHRKRLLIILNEIVSLYTRKYRSLIGKRVILRTVHGHEVNGYLKGFEIHLDSVYPILYKMCENGSCDYELYEWFDTDDVLSLDYIKLAKRSFS